MKHDNLGHNNSGHELVELGEGSGLVSQIGIDECIRLATSVKKNIIHRNLDHLLTMDVGKLKSLADVKLLSFSKKRGMYKMIKDIASKFNILETPKK